MSSLKKCSITKINHKKKGMFIEQILGVLMRSFLLEKAHGSIPRKKKMKTRHRRFSHLSFWRSCIHGLCFFTSPLTGLSLTHTHISHVPPLKKRHGSHASVL